ncbi:MAG: hypothetical protein M1820_004748 [Bogoriella megaspora]|nr:MAG: hypothetical protein M1820_004748 [Bogoriella megaspora]
MSGQNPLHVEAIRNSIARYCLILDTKSWADLSYVFTSEADASYPFPGGDLHGVESIRGAIRTRLEPVTTQHAVTTQMIHVNENGDIASAVTYFTGVHFGTERYEGEALTAYGKYEDDLVFSNEQWRIKKRVCSFMGRIGNQNVMKPLNERN